MKSANILGVEIPLSEPYAEGHQITAAEAKALNQTRRENICNNFRKQMKAALAGEEGAKTPDEVVAEIQAYDGSYEFSLAAAGGTRSSLSPVEKEARRLGKQWLVAKLKEMGKSLKQYMDEHGEDYVKSKVLEVADSEGIQAAAKKNVAAAAKTADAVAVEI